MSSWPNSKHQIGKVLIYVGFSLILGGVAIVGLYFCGVPETSGVLGKWLFVLGALVALIGRKLRAQLADEALEQDTRRPIVYLRSFSEDRFLPSFFYAGLGLEETEEESLAKIFNQIGPFIAIGKPGERFTTLGAYRKYVGDDWKEVVLGLLDHAQFVIVRIGDSEGVYWEFENVVTRVPPEQILLYFPRSLRMRKRKKLYVSFVKEMTNRIPCVSFPKSPGFSDFWGFDKNWNIIEFYGEATLSGVIRGFWATIRRQARSSHMSIMISDLHPFFVRAGLPLPKTPFLFRELILVPLMTAFFLGVLAILVMLGFLAISYIAKFIYGFA